MLLSYSETVPREIKAEMVLQNLSQFELATRIGWRQQKLQRRLTGHVELTIADLEKITGALGVALSIELTGQRRRVRS